MSELYDVITANNQGGAFPNTRAINSSGPLATDGTELLKEVRDDVWATKQAELDFYNNSPNGLPNDSGVDFQGSLFSQPLFQQYMNFQTPGSVVPIFWPPDRDAEFLGGGIGFDIRILILQGQGINRSLAAFRMLDRLLYVGDANNNTADSFYRALAPDGIVRNINGFFLIMADMRGQFLRGDDPGALVDPDGASRIPGSIQLDALQEITGSFESRQSQGADGSDNIIFQGPAGGSFTVTNNGGTILISRANASGGAIITDLTEFNSSDSVSPNVAKTDPVETRSVNLSVRWGIYF